MTLKPQKIILLFIPAIVLTLGLSICFQSLLAAWTAPLANPATCLTGNPGCDAPISSGSPLVQQMQGALWIVDSAYPASLNGLIVEKGNVGIGTINPGAKLEIKGPDASTASQEIVRFVAGNNSYRGAIKQDAFDASDYAGSVRDMVLLGVNNGWNIAGETDIKFTTYQGGWQRRMTIQNNGNVGIGTTGPGVKLHTYGTDPEIRAETSFAGGDSNISLKNPSQQWNWALHGSTSDFILRDVTGGTVPLTIENTAPNNSIYVKATTGNVGIGTTNPNQKLHVISASGASVASFDRTSDVDSNVRDFIDFNRGSAGRVGGLKTSNTAVQLWGKTELQLGINEAAKATINSAGNLYVSGTAYANGQALCQANGTNCPAQTGYVPYEGAGRSVSSWMVSALRNGAGGPYIYLSHPSGYGMHINTYNTSNDVYAMELHNNANQLLGVYNSGRVVMGLSGNVGIGMANPAAKLEVAGAVKANIFAPTTGDSPNSSYNHYAIYEEPGAWSHPYPDLMIEYHTGIKYVAYAGYGGHRFYTGYNADASPAGLAFSVGEGDGHVRAYNNLYVTGTAYANGQALCQANGTNCPASSGLKLDTWQGNHYSGSDGAEYATIFYDTNDGGYYVDPHSSSKLNQVHIVDVRPQYMYDWNDPAYYIDMNGSSRLNYLGRNYGWNWTEYDWNDGNYYMDLNAVSILNDLRVNILYDKQNTGYYVDPNATTKLNNLQIAGGSPGAGKVLTSDASGNASWQAKTNSLQNCAWSNGPYVCNGNGSSKEIICPAGKVAAGVRYYPGSGNCGRLSNQIDVYCCEIK